MIVIVVIKSDRKDVNILPIDVLINNLNTLLYESSSMLNNDPPKYTFCVAVVETVLLNVPVDVIVVENSSISNMQKLNSSNGQKCRYRKALVQPPHHGVLHNNGYLCSYRYISMHQYLCKALYYLNFSLHFYVQIKTD